MSEYRDVPCYTTPPTSATFDSLDKLAIFKMSNNVNMSYLAVSNSLVPVYCFRVGNATYPTFYIVSTFTGVKVYWAWYHDANLSLTKIVGDTTFYYTTDYFNGASNLPYTYYFGYYDTADDGFNDIARGNSYPITYRLTNCTAPSAPTEAVIGDTVNVPLEFPNGYGFPNPATDVYVYNNGVLVPSSYANNILTFTMPDPS